MWADCSCSAQSVGCHGVFWSRQKEKTGEHCVGLTVWHLPVSDNWQQQKQSEWAQGNCHYCIDHTHTHLHQRRTPKEMSASGCWCWKLYSPPPQYMCSLVCFVITYFIHWSIIHRADCQFRPVSVLCCLILPLSLSFSSFSFFSFFISLWFDSACSSSSQWLALQHTLTHAHTNDTSIGAKEWIKNGEKVECRRVPGAWCVHSWCEHRCWLYQLANCQMNWQLLRGERERERERERESWGLLWP